MAFGKKGRQIRRLQTELAGYREIETLVPLAREIGKRAAAAARVVEGAGSPNMDVVMDAVMDELTAEQKQALLLERFRQLPIQEQLTMLGRHFTDEQTRQALEAESNRLLERDAFKRSIKHMQAECKEQARINLSDVPVDSRLQVDLYNVSLFKEQDAWGLREDEPDRALTVTSLGGGRFRVLKDDINDALAGTLNSLSSYQTKQKTELGCVIRLGAALPADDDRHYAYYSAPLHFSREDGSTAALDRGFTQLALGYAAVDGHEVMSGSTLPWSAFPEDKRPFGYS